MGPQSTQIAKTFAKFTGNENGTSKHPTTGNLSYVELLSQFDTHFSASRPNVVKLRREFHRRHQRTKEDLPAFYRALVSAAQQCEFDDARYYHSYNMKHKIMNILNI